MPVPDPTPLVAPLRRLAPGLPGGLLAAGVRDARRFLCHRGRHAPKPHLFLVPKNDLLLVGMKVAVQTSNSADGSGHQ